MTRTMVQGVPTADLIPSIETKPITPYNVEVNNYVQSETLQQEHKSRRSTNYHAHHLIFMRMPRAWA